MLVVLAAQSRTAYTTTKSKRKYAHFSALPLCRSPTFSTRDATGHIHDATENLRRLREYALCLEKITTSVFSLSRCWRGVPVDVLSNKLYT